MTKIKLRVGAIGEKNFLIQIERFLWCKNV